MKVVARGYKKNTQDEYPVCVRLFKVRNKVARVKEMTVLSDKISYPALTEHIVSTENDKF